MGENELPLKVAIVGGGIAGIMAAHLLSKRYEVTLFERESWLGGHTNTITIPSGPDAGLAIDTGFIVCNPDNYPRFYAFLDELGVPTRDSDMTFCFSSKESGFTYNGPTLSAFLVEPLNLLNPSFIRMIIEQRRFNRAASTDLSNRTIGSLSLGEYCRRLGLSDFFIQSYLVPLIASIWSSPDASIEEFPALTFITFFNNHGMLNFNRLPRWQTIANGAQSYVRAFTKNFRGTINLSSAVAAIERDKEGVTLTLQNGNRHRYNKVILATHADISLAMLTNPSQEEVNLLGAWKYSTNHTVLHTDARLMPKKRKLWGSWNYTRMGQREAELPVCISYYMNRLQGLKAHSDYFVSLNCTEHIDPKSVIYDIAYTHPVYTPLSVASQVRIREINGANNTFYCGAYLGYGFHEDAVNSAYAVAARLEAV
ncbi:MAG: FAD-dependent oxidoreductase [Oligoflexia bacterium]|nr:FAD-dependent oxidoreductase [Oligoflexia bacterium]